MLVLDYFHYMSGSYSVIDIHIEVEVQVVVEILLLSRLMLMLRSRSNPRSKSRLRLRLNDSQNIRDSRKFLHYSNYILADCGIIDQGVVS